MIRLLSVPLQFLWFLAEQYQNSLEKEENSTHINFFHYSLLAVRNLNHFNITLKWTARNPTKKNLYEVSRPATEFEVLYEMI